MPVVEQEEIPNEHLVSRPFFHVVAQSISLDPTSHFVFGPDRKKKYKEPERKFDRAESAFWRKYAVEAAVVHERGLAILARRNSRIAEKGGSPLGYAGFGTAAAQKIRSIQVGDLKLFVVHAPEENDDPAHVNIFIRTVAGENVKSLDENLQRAFGLALFQLLHPTIEVGPAMP